MKFAKMWLVVLIISVISTSGIVNAQNSVAQKTEVAQKVDPNHPKEKAKEVPKDLIKTPVSPEVVQKKISKRDLSCR